MPTTFASLEAEALKLTAEERARLADRLLTSISGDREIEDAWFAEVERRIAAVEAGHQSLVPAEHSIALARQAIA